MLTVFKIWITKDIMFDDDKTKRLRKRSVPSCAGCGSVFNYAVYMSLSLSREQHSFNLY